MRRIVLLIAIAVFAIGGGLFVTRANRRPLPARPLVITFSVRTGGADESPQLTELQTLAYRGPNEWRRDDFQIVRGDHQTETVTNAMRFLSRARTNEFMSMNDATLVDPNFRSAAYLRSHPEFVRTERVAGFQTYVLRAEGDGTIVERNYAPEVGLTPLRTYVRLKDGTQIITDAMNVQFREVDKAETALPEGNESFVHIESEIAGADSAKAAKLTEQVREAKNRLGNSTQ